MRGTALAAAVLLLAGCGGGSDEPEALEAGPLDLRGGEMSCVAGDVSDKIVISLSARGNTADIPLTIDEVSLVDAENGLLDRARLGDGPAVDATILERALSGRMQLHLHVRRPDPELPVRFEAVAVDYHNVEGRFRTTSEPFEVTGSCRP